MRRLLPGVVLALALLAAPAGAGNPAPGFTDTAFVGGLSTPAAVKVYDPVGGTTTALGTIPVCCAGEDGAPRRRGRPELPRRWCMEFGGVTSFLADTRFGGKNAPAPASCP